MMRQMRKGSRRKIDSDGDGGTRSANDARRSSDTSSRANSDTTSSHYSRTLKNRGRLRDAVAQGRKKKQELRKKISGGKKEDQKSSSILPISGGFKGRSHARLRRSSFSTFLSRAISPCSARASRCPGRSTTACRSASRRT